MLAYSALSPNAGQRNRTKLSRLQDLTPRQLPQARVLRRPALIVRHSDLRDANHKIQEIRVRDVRQPRTRPLPQPLSRGPEQQGRARLCIAHQLSPKKRWKIT